MSCICIVTTGIAFEKKFFGKAASNMQAAARLFAASWRVKRAGISSAAMWFARRVGTGGDGYEWGRQSMRPMKTAPTDGSPVLLYGELNGEINGKFGRKEWAVCSKTFGNWRVCGTDTYGVTCG